METSPQTFLTHHIQQITKAAVFYDAKAILRSVDVRKAVAARPHDGAHPHAASLASRAASPTSNTDADSDSDGEVGGSWA